MIKAQNLTKVFRVHKKDPGLKGSIRSLFRREWLDKVALDNVSLDINEGEIVGLVGANGAGKTTLVKLLSGIIHPTQGTASVLGFTPWERKNDFRRQIGLLMGQKAQLWWDLPAADSFILLREMYGVEKKVSEAMLRDIADTLNVSHLLNIPVRKLSLGERMKMELIAVLLHRPRVIFLDEPTLGLDITAQKSIRRFLLNYSDSFKPAMMITSHYMEDIEQLCKRIIIIRQGSFVYDGPLDDVLSRYATHKQVTVRLKETISEGEVRAKLGRAGSSIISIEEDQVKFRIPRNDVAGLMSILFRELSVHDISIEEQEIASIIETLMNKGLVSESEERHVAG